MKIKDLGLKITEREYRELKCISYSLLSTVDREGYKALKDVFKPTIATKFGVLTESILFGDYIEDEYYIIPKMEDVGDTLKDACDIIFPKLMRVPYGNHKLSDYKKDIEAILKNVDIDYYKKRTVESRAETIIKNASEYWLHMSKSHGKIIITQEMLDKAKIAANTLKTHKFTSDIFNTHTFMNVEKISQFKLKYKLYDYDIKVMLDWLVIDHDNKIIKPYDLKTGGKDVEEFEKSFFYWRYDIQAFFYNLAVKTLAKRYYPNYKIEPFRFVYISRNNVYKPIIWKITDKQLKGTFKGFYKNDVYYKGVLELINEYNWYVDGENIYYSKEVYDNSGELVINNDIIINDTKRENRNQSK